ncbi:unnamed protein product [Didymodactylos carnosus]|uniref:NHL repeat-containing protein n=1 Tax=Didymodactylos carnosus TaxID=1234261 RepID=A0A814HLB6_9BILA|nr:unnamed protein product [Didymodactylos carnosus]CAF3781747.1 unnamed protein product [Didymodactylos carnosus]
MELEMELISMNSPYDVIVDKERDSLIICDLGNKRVVRWPRRNGTGGETLISNISCMGLTMDENGSLYVTDNGKHEVRRYGSGDTEGTVVAGGNGSGNRLDQLSNPCYIFVDRDHAVYVSDHSNYRVMKWEEGAKRGIVVAGGKGEGNSLSQLADPMESLLINWALSMWLIVILIESCVGQKEPHREVSLLVETAKEDGRIN